jgi:hypothetical protein
MSAGKLKGYCSVCRRGYRGSYTVHMATRSHQLAAARAARRRGDQLVRHNARKGATLAAIRSARKNEEDYIAAGLAKVRAHKRRRPLDGPRRSVRVRRYGRQRPQIWTEIRRSGGHFLRVTFSSVTGKALSARPAGRHVRAESRI